MADWVAADITAWLDGLGVNASEVEASFADMNIYFSPNHHHQNPLAAAICQRWGSCSAAVVGTNVVVNEVTIPLPQPVRDYLAG